MANTAVLLEREGKLARITLNRPEVLNAQNLEWVQGLNVAVDQVSADPQVQLVLIQGAGRSFCSGLDLNMMAAEGMPAGFYEGHEQALCRIESMDKIVVAALHGHCLGGGLQLAIACDIRICSTDCQIGLPAVNEGLFPGLAPFRLPRLIGLGPARRLILSGEPIDAQEALGIGLVDHLVPAEGFKSGLAEVLESYLRAPATASVASKKLMKLMFDAPRETVYQESLPLLRACLESPELRDAGETWKRRRVGRQ